MSRLVGVLLACLFLVTPSVDALCRASCTPAAIATPSCHARAATPERPHLTTAAACQREVVIAAPILDGRRTAGAPTAVAATAAALLVPDTDTRYARRHRSCLPAVLSPPCPRCPVLRI